MHNKLECECEEACVKDTLINLEINNKNTFIGVEQGQGKNQ